MPATSEAGLLEVLTIAVCQGLPDQLAAGTDVEADRHFGMLHILRPAGDAGFADEVDIAAQSPDARRLGRAKKSGALRNTPPRRFDFVTFVTARCAIAYWAARPIRIERAVFMRIVEHAPVIVVDKAL